MKKLLALTLSWITLLLVPVISFAETLTFTTYYPAPFGAYDTIRLVPRAAPACNAANEGLMYYNTADNMIYFCDAANFQELSGIWDFDNANNDITPFDSTANADINATRLGIGTLAPELKLDLNDGIISRGTFGAGLTLTTTGAGTRMFWYPREAAFRAGTIDGAQWDAANIGNYSVAFGNSNTASGTGSFIGSGFGNQAISMSSAIAGGDINITTGQSAFVGAGGRNNANGFNSAIAGGSRNTANGDDSAIAGGASNTANGAQSSVAGGQSNVASGARASVAGGNNNTASGVAASVAGGNNNTASGDAATALGNNTTAQAFSSIVGGRWNVIRGTTNAWNAAEPLFVLGNGTGAGARSSAFVVEKSGDTGIGTDDPASRLEVNFGGNGRLCIGDVGHGATWPGLANCAQMSTTGYALIQENTGANTFINKSGAAGYIGFRVANNDMMIVRQDGFVGIGTTAPGQRLHVAGDVTADAYLYNSDERGKQNIHPISGALDKILQINGVEFDFKESGRHAIGVTAQNIEKHFPEAIRTNKGSDFKSVDYPVLIAPLIEAIKEQQAQIKELEARLNLLMENAENSCSPPPAVPSM